MDNLTTRAAKQIAFHGRNRHDVSEGAEEFWANTGTEARDIALIQARAVVALVLDEAAQVCGHRMMTKTSATVETILDTEEVIRALGVQS